MKPNWTLALAAIALILGSTSVEAKPATQTGTVTRSTSLPGGGKITLTGTEQETRTVVVVTVYNPDGTVYGSQRADKRKNR